jgi:serine/threonine-protein kinase
MFCPHSGLVAGTDTQWRNRLGSELRTRLRAVASLAVVATTAFTLRRLWYTPTFSTWVTDALLAICVLVAIVLYVREEITLKQLRLLELGLFGALTISMAYVDYSLVVPPLLAGDYALALAEWNRSLAHVFLVIAAYAMFIPNTWKRAAGVVIPISTWPLLISALLAWSYPDQVRAAGGVLTYERLSFTVIMLALIDAVAIYGTYVINSLRTQAAAAATMGQYELEEKIAQGGMGEVWRARHQLLKRPAAIKLVRPKLLGGNGAGDPERVLRRFEREAKATAGLRSPHSVDLYDYGVTGEGTFYYVMELLDGVDLESLVQQHGPLPAQRTMYLLRQACDSLADAHTTGLVHRDIKPANLYSCRMGVVYDFVKVLDFGLVKYESQEDAATKLTVEGVTSGTPAYMPPEMALGSDAVDQRADIYSLGCVGYWLLTGQLVFAGESPMAMVVEHVNTAPTPPSQRTETQVPAELDRIILKCLAKDPSERYQSALELAADLETCCSTVPAWSNKEAREWWQIHMPDVSGSEVSLAS